MIATAQKIKWARRAIVEMRKAEANASVDDFQYHFGAFLALLGALRQFLLVKPYKPWVYGTDTTDLCYCTCIDLRNVDVHVNNVAGKPRSNYDARFETFTNTIATVSAEVDRVDGPTENVADKPEPDTVADPAQTTQTITATFYVNPATLPNSFAVLLNGTTRPSKSTELTLLATDSAVDIAERGLNYFERTVVPGAQAQGIPIP